MKRVPTLGALHLVLTLGLTPAAAVADVSMRVLATQLCVDPSLSPKTLSKPQPVTPIAIGRHTGDASTAGNHTVARLTSSSTTIEKRTAASSRRRTTPARTPSHAHESSDGIPVRGRVLGWDGAALVGASVDVPGLAMRTTTDARGRFAMHLPPGRHPVRVARMDHVALRSVFDVRAPSIDGGADSASLSGSYTFELEALDLQVETVTVRAPRLETPRDQPGRYLLHAKDMEREIGSFEDIMRSVQSLPGVARASDYHGEYFVRGAGSSANAVYLDGIPIFFPYHILGFNSIFNPGIVESAEFYAGGAPAAYGGSTGGLMLVRSRGETPGIPGGDVGLSYLSGHLRAAGGGADRSWVLSLRRSYHDQIARIVDRSSPNEIPSFHDGMLRMRWKPSADHVLVAGLLSAGDGMSIANPEGQALRSDFVRVDDENGAIETGQDQLAMNNRLRLGSLYWGAQLGEGSSLETRVGLAPQRLRFSLKGSNNESLDIDTKLLSLRQDLTLHRGAHRFRLGFETYRTQTNGIVSSYAAFLNLRQTNSSLNLSDQPERYRINVASTRLYGAAYGQDDWRVWNGRLHFSPGLRYEFDSLTHELLVSPRAALAVRPGRDWEIRGTWGVYSTLRNTPMEVQPTTSGDPLRSERAVETSLGLTREWGRTWKVGATGYQKSFLNLVYESEPAYYDNGAEARSHGVEAWLEMSPAKHPLHARLQYAWSKTQQRDASAWRRRLQTDAQTGESVWGPVYEDPYWYSPLQDQRHRLGLDVRFQSRSWEFATQLQLASGLPYTPVASVAHDADGKAYGIVGRRGSARLPLYRRLDFRVTRHFRGDSLHWRLYAEVLNATAADNILMYRWNRGYTSQYAVNMLPLLPTLGVEASF